MIGFALFLWHGLQSDKKKKNRWMIEKEGAETSNPLIFQVQKCNGNPDWN